MPVGLSSKTPSHISAMLSWSLTAAAVGIFGGADGDTRFAACGDRVFKRKLKVKGAFGFQPPVKPAKPRL